MKKYILLFLFFVPVLSAAQQNTFYYYKGEKRSLIASTSEVYVKYKSSVLPSRKTDLMKSFGRLTLKKEQPLVMRALRYELNAADRSESKMTALLAQLRATPEVESAYPAFMTLEGDTLYVTNEVIYMPKTKGDARLQSMNAEVSANVIETFRMGRDKEQVLVRLDDGVDPFLASQRMVESGLVEFAQPNFMHICYSHQNVDKATKTPKPAIDEAEERIRQMILSSQPRPTKNPFLPMLPTRPIRFFLTPNDPSFSQQWFLQNTGQTIGGQTGTVGADISATTAWDLTTGSSTVVVSVWDSGYDLTHPELAGKITSSYDAAGTDGLSGFGGPAVPQNPGAANENHGTPCAGLIAALTNNNSSVASVGYNVSVHLVRNGFNFNSSGGFSTTDAVIARCASATDTVTGLVAVSQSWGGGSGNASWEASFSSVRTNARGGLGAVMLFSAGNSGASTVGYPARAANIIAVGATDNTDRKAGFSQFGNDLDVVAPGVSTLTIDRAGTAGYTTNNETSFGGTSAACPIAAGVVALAASANPALTGTQLEEILQTTTDKVGGYPYGTASGRTLGTWTFQMGYGRVNARRAVQAALGNPTLTLTNPVSGASWTKGQSVNITWTNTGIITGNVVIDLLKGGAFNSSISAGTPNTGTFAYTPPGALADGNDYQIRLTANSGTVVETSPLFSILTVGGVFRYSPATTFNVNTGYTDLGSNGSAITTANFDDANSAPVNIGFNFDYNGRVYNQFILNTNGFIKLGSTNPSSAALFITTPQDQTGAGGVLASTNALDVDIISVLNHDLQAGTSTPEYRVHTTGTAPNRVCTIQFKNVREKSTAVPIQYDNMNFQIKLYESGVVEFVYGTFAPSTGAPTFRTFGMGIKGLSTAAAEVVVLNKGSATAWNAPFGTATGNIFVLSRTDITFNVRNNVNPDVGRTYRFVPQNPATRLAIVNPLAPTINIPFAVIAQVQDAGGNPQPAPNGGTATLSLTAGSGTLGGTLTATVNPGQNVVIFRNLTYNTAQSGVQLTVSGLSLTAGSSTFTVVAPSPQQIYSNGPLVTNPAEGTNFADASNLATGLGSFGFQHSITSLNRVADEFVVPAGQGWRLDSLVFYAYQTGSPITSTINNVNLRIWRGRPGDVGSQIVFGNTTTNRMARTQFSGIYRVSGTLTNTDRPLMAQTVALTNGITLAPGTYWLDWQTGGTLTSGPWVPPITIEGQTTTGNARQFNGTAWVDILDNAAPQGLPFIVFGEQIPNAVITETATPAVGTASTTTFTGTSITFVADVTTSGILTVTSLNSPPRATTLPGGILRASQYYWDFTNTDMVFTNGRVSIPLTALAGVTNPATLRWLKRDNSTSAWQNIGGTINAGNLESTVAFNSFSEFAIGDEGGDNPLPVELSAFTGAATREGVRLNWTTASERQNAGFVVLRSASEETSSQEQQEIASFRFSPELKGKGTTTTATNYSFLDGGVEVGKRYTYKLRSFDLDGTVHDYAQTVSVEVREPVQARVFSYNLSQNYPNPFNPTTSIKYSIREAGNVNLKVYDLLGREVLTLVNQVQAPGEYQVTFDANNLAASGMYIYRLQSGNFTRTMKMLLVK